MSLDCELWSTHTNANTAGRTSHRYARSICVLEDKQLQLPTHARPSCQKDKLSTTHAHHTLKQTHTQANSWAGQPIKLCQIVWHLKCSRKMGGNGNGGHCTDDIPHTFPSFSLFYDSFPPDCIVEISFGHNWPQITAFSHYYLHFKVAYLYYPTKNV